MKIESPHRARFFALLGFLFAFRAWFMTTLPLSGDEAYHWEWSRHLAWGYYDHPGLTAYLIRLSTWLFGRSTEFTVRLPALILISATAVVCFLAARYVAGRRGADPASAEHSGWIAGLLVLVTPIYVVFSMYISTDPPVIFFSALALYTFCRAFCEDRWTDWIGAGIALGLAMLGKFLAFMIVPAAVLFLLVSPEHRRKLFRPKPWVAAIVSLVVFSPFLWWNATHDWATFRFNFVSRQTDNILAPLHVPEFVLSQAFLALTPGIFALCIWALGPTIRQWRTKKDGPALYLALYTLIPLLYFLYVSLRRQVGLHWTAPAWIGAFVGYACYGMPALASRPAYRRLTKASFGLCIAVTVLLHLVAHVPPSWIESITWRYRMNPNRINAAKLADRYGWRRLGPWVSGVRNEMLTNGVNPASNVFVVSPQYGTAAAVSFYMPDHIPAHLWASRKVHGENYRFWDDYPALKGQDALFVTKDEEDMTNGLPRLQRHFRRVGKPESLAIRRDGKIVRYFYLVRCYAFNGRTPYSVE